MKQSQVIEKRRLVSPATTPQALAWDSRNKKLWMGSRDLRRIYVIDPESGMLAKGDCPVRSRMTYPSGSQPTAYCHINHAPPPKKSRVKEIADKILQ